MPNTRARTLRKNPTDAERQIWNVLRRKQIDGHRFRRQHPMGPYIVDFVCLERKLIIEVDGGQHALSVKRDTKRTEWLEKHGYKTLRFWNHDVFANLEGLLETIRNALSQHS